MATELAPGAYERRWATNVVDGGPDVLSPRGTIVLEPTRKQLAAGVRMLVVDDTTCANARDLRALADRHGWSTVFTRSRYQTAVATQGKRKGQRHDVETVALRLWSVERAMVGYAAWEFDVERGGPWAFESAALARVISWSPRRIEPPVRWGWEQMKAMIMLVTERAG